MKNLPWNILNTAVGSISALQEIASEKSVLVWRNQRGYSMLHLACEAGEAIVVNLLLAAGYDWRENTHDKCNALDIAIHSGHLAIVQLLIASGAYLDSEHSSQNSLDLACVTGDIEMIEWLCLNGANVNGVKGRQPIFWAIEADSIDGLSLLIEYGADVNCIEVNEHVPNGRWSPLRKAAGEGFTDAISLLAKSGADIDFQDADGFTPLMLALLYENEESAAKLIELGADMKIQNSDGKTASDIAAEVGIVV